MNTKILNDKDDFLFYLKDELKEALDTKNLKLGKVLRRPIEGLVAFHQSH